MVKGRSYSYSLIWKTLYLTVHTTKLISKVFQEITEKRKEGKQKPPMITFYGKKVNTEMCKCNKSKYYGSNSDYQ